MHYHLLIPSLEMVDQADLAVIAPALMRFRSLRQRRKTEWPGFEQRLAELLIPADIAPARSIASICRLSMGLPPEGRWLCVSPVFLETGIERVILHDLDLQHLLSDEANDLIEAFNQHFSEEGLILEAGSAGLWFIHLPDHLDIRTHTLHLVRGQSIYHLLPAGENSGYWHALMNEVQMLFHQHPVNAGRERQGRIPVNGIWLWGEAHMTGKARTKWDCVLTDEAMARGMAISEGIPCFALEQGLPDVGPGVHVLLVDDTLQRALAYSDHDAWVAGLGKLEENFFEPLCHAWNERRLQGLIIETDGYSIDVSGRSHWRFWEQC
jgi:hypothetical protein